jgi:hypothetical protein
MNFGSPDRAERLQLVAGLRENLVGSERELLNSALFQITRQCLERRTARLRQEIEDLEHPTPFITSGELATPRGTKGEP